MDLDFKNWVFLDSSEYSSQELDEMNKWIKSNFGKNWYYTPATKKAWFRHEHDAITFKLKYS